MSAEYKRRAAEQLEAILSYIAQVSPQNAIDVLTRIEDAADLLDRNPRIVVSAMTLVPAFAYGPFRRS